jgi:hypothetical protein
VGESEEEVIDNLHGADDWIAEQALARGALLRQLVGELLPACGRRFMHPRRPAEVDALGIRPVGHGHGC